VADLFSAILSPKKHFKPCSLVKLRLDGNSIDEEGIRVICTILKQSATIEDLSLSNNFLHTDGTRMLVETLAENKTVKRLNISSNFLKDDGAQVVCSLLRLPTCYLEHRDLQDNFITDKSVECLVKALTPNLHLQELDLRKNEQLHLDLARINPGINVLYDEPHGKKRRKKTNGRSSEFINVQ